MEKAFFHNKGEDSTLQDIRDFHTIPVFSRDNIPMISQADAIGVCADNISKHFDISPEPYVRLSHPIKGRRFEARHKKTSELLPEDETIYYERMAAIFNLGYTTKVNGQDADLTLTLIKPYNLDNNSKASNSQNFKVAIGYNVKVCLNMAYSVQGTKTDIRVHNIDELSANVMSLIQNYDSKEHLKELKHLNTKSLTYDQVIHVLGKSRMYDALPARNQREACSDFQITDTQMRSVAKGYWHDQNFGGNNTEISMWGFYNLLTEACKNSYIDTFVDTQLNATKFVNGLCDTLEGKENEYSFFLN